VHEGGCATPFIAHWPGGIKERNKLRRTPAHVIDVVPTILDLAGLELTRQVPSPGRSLRRTFLEDGRPLHEKLWWLHDGHRALRVGDWKLVAAKDQPWELFHLAVDRTETRNLAKAHPEIVLAMADQWNSLTNSFASPARKIPPQ
jgi:arylsulfatase